jgi:hypothetical protein
MIRHRTQGCRHSQCVTAGPLLPLDRVAVRVLVPDGRLPTIKYIYNVIKEKYIYIMLQARVLVPDGRLPAAGWPYLTPHYTASSRSRRWTSPGDTNTPPSRKRLGLPYTLLLYIHIIAQSKGMPRTPLSPLSPSGLRRVYGAVVGVWLGLIAAGRW